MDEDADCKTYIDSSDLVAGLTRAELKNKLRKGRNGDLWTLLFRLIQDKNISIEAVKVKSHVETREDWMKYGMNEEKNVQCMADTIASNEAKKYIRSEANQDSDVQVLEDAYLVALRGSLIEVPCWEAQEDRVIIDPSTTR